MSGEPSGPSPGRTPSRSVPLHRRVERLFGSGDMRLIYGMAVPLLIVVGLVIALAVSGRTWLVAPLVLMLIVLTGVVMVGINQMLGDEDEDEEEEDERPEQP